MAAASVGFTSATLATSPTRVPRRPSPGWRRIIGTRMVVSQQNEPWLNSPCSQKASPWSATTMRVVSS